MHPVPDRCAIKWSERRKRTANGRQDNVFGDTGIHWLGVRDVILHHIHIPSPPANEYLFHNTPVNPPPPPMNTSVTDDIFVAAILAAICSAFSALAPNKMHVNGNCKWCTLDSYFKGPI